jgi:TPR repeat protein
VARGDHDAVRPDGLERDRGAIPLATFLPYRRGMRRSASVACAVLFPVLLLACPGPPMPPAPAPAGHLAAITCGPHEKHCSPLVVDQPQDVRSDLGVAMSTGIAVVACDGHSVRLLKDCRVDGTYRFIRLPRDVEAQQIKNAQEVGINLPAIAVTLGARVEAAYEGGAALDVAWEVVGRRRTTWQSVTREDLLGGDMCAGATHFVRGADVGAFSVKTGRHGVARVAAEILGSGGNGQTAGSEDIENHGGMDEACADYDKAPGDAEAPVNCAAPVRLELTAIDEGQTQAAEKDARTPKAPAMNDPTCPQGYVLAQGLCVRADEQQPHACEPDDAADCDMQCKRGNGDSCANEGFLYVNGKSVGQDDARGEQLFELGCKGGSALACYDLGLMQYLGRGTGKDVVAAARSFKIACDRGYVTACSELGILYSNGDLPRDATLAVGYYQRGCDGGDQAGCTNLAFMLLNGAGVKQDLVKATELNKLACNGGQPVACNNLGYALESGRGLPRDVVEGSRFYSRACKLGESMACLNLGTLFEVGLDVGGGKSVRRDDDAARKLYELAYEHGEVKSIPGAILRVVYHQNREIPAEELRHELPMQIDACNGGSPKNCGTLAFLLIVAGKQDEGVRAMAHGCELGDPWSCFEMKRLGLANGRPSVGTP